jgi:hypothetical protein
MASAPQWKVVGAILALDTGYFLLLLLFFWVARDTSIAAFVLRGLPVLYFVLPAVLNLVILIASRTFTASRWLRIISLTAWSLIIPQIVTFTAIFVSMYACHFGIIPNCAPY